MRIACIGSRSITDAQKDLFQDVGAGIVDWGHTISSGNADGSDFAFASGANEIAPENVILYLPWKSYNEQNIHFMNKVLDNPKHEWMDFTAPFHPGWAHLKHGARLLMARNWGIIHKADKVIALLNYNKPGGGGTGQGVRIAKHLGKPILDLNGKGFNGIMGFLGL